MRANLEPPANDVLMTRVLSRIEVTPTGCWEWQGAKHVRYPYGLFGYTVQGKTKVFWVHRWVYEQLVGPVPDGLVLDHRVCDNPPCCNPDHLVPCTNRTNILRSRGMSAINARKTHCKRGHELAGDNLYIRKRGDRQERWCRTCLREKRRKAT